MNLQNANANHRLNKFQPLSPSVNSSANKLAYKNLYHTKEDLSSSKGELKPSKRNRTFDNFNNRSDYRSVSTENSMNSQLKNSSSKNEKELSNYSNKNNSNSYFKSAMSEWKEKCFKLQKDNDSLRTNLILEKKKVIELEKRLKLNDKKVNSFDNVNDQLSKFVMESENVQNRYEQSELIRKEQSKLIKSLQYEIEILRKYTDINIPSEKTNGTNTESNDTQKSPIAKKKLKKKKKKSVEPTAKTNVKTMKK